MDNNKIIFYSTHCPKCKVVELKLKQKHLDYIENNNVDEMLALGIQSAPCLQIGEQLLNFKQSVDYINEL